MLKSYFDPIQSRSHLLILIMVIVSFYWFIHPDFIDTYSFSRDWLMEWDIPRFILQLTLYQFLHGDLLHLFLNAYCLYSIWPVLEARIKRNNFDLFFLANTFFVAAALWIFHLDIWFLVWVVFVWHFLDIFGLICIQLDILLHPK